MNAKKISTSLLVVTAINILVALAFSVRIASTADSVAVLKTTGMTYGSCSNKVTRALESIKGVAVAEVDVAGSLVIVGYDTKTVNPENLAEKVRETGVNSKVSEVLTLEQFRQRTDNKLGQHATSGSGCCGGKGGHDQTTQTKHPD